ncbi:MAG TPA: NAD(P)/FAD-dependent oxidoreductase [Polyangiaceae bacterium]|jgi:NADH dehydrogenase|nr:NAD(P)/FAD-dependent oxidoreductase [Polyangiaceae bacterium]
MDQRSPSPDVEPPETPGGGPAPHRILVLGGGFGGIHLSRELERLFSDQPEVELTLVSQDNFFLLTPLLFEACSGTLELRHCSVPIRACLRRTRFVEGSLEGPIDFERRIVRVRRGASGLREFAYDQLVLAVGAWTNQRLIPGSEYAFTFKTLADAILLRNHVIECFEAADAELDPGRRRALLTFAIVGGGLVGTELLGELSAFAHEIVRYYPCVRRTELRFLLFEHSDRIMPELEPELVRHAMRVLSSREGVEIRTSTPVKAIEAEAVQLAGERIPAATIVLAAGTLPSSAVGSLDLAKGKRGHVRTDAALRTSRPEVWALGDCAEIPGPDGRPYPYLAQHALREARLLARNVRAAYLGEALQPFHYDSLGVMASLGGHEGVARILSLRVHGFLAWWLRRTYYLLQTPGLDRKLRIVVDWTVALFLRPDVVKLDTAGERALLLRSRPAGAAALPGSGGETASVRLIEPRADRAPALA